MEENIFQMSQKFRIAQKVSLISLISPGMSAPAKEDDFHFSKKVVMSFTSIVLLPLLMFFAGGSALMNSQSRRGLKSICEQESGTNAEKIYSSIRTYELIDKMIRSDVDLSLFITAPESRDESEVIDTVKELSAMLERIISVAPSLHAVRIFANSPLVPERFPVILHSDREDLRSLAQWEFNYRATYLGNLKLQERPSVTLTRELVNGKRSVGWVQVSMRTEDFFPFVRRRDNPQEHDFVLTVHDGGDGKPVLSQLVLEPGNMGQPLLSERETERLCGKILRQKDSAVLNGKKSVFSCREIPELGLIIVHSCETRMISVSVLTSMLGSLVLLLFTAMGFYFIVRQTSTNLFSGVYSVMRGMREVSAGDLSVQIPLSGTSEVRETQAIFNSMTHQLSAQMEQIKTEQQLIADTEMKAMQNQINAHFLYNVLETIHMQAVLADDDDVAKSILILGKMLRYCLRWRVHTVTLEKEMEYIDAYISILNIRNDYTISLENKISPALNGLKIPKMILQPFVENSFVHAIEPLGRDSAITIYAEPDEEGGKLWLCVEDYGIGMDEPTLEGMLSYLYDEGYERDSTGSIGIKNIQQRLFMFYGKDFRLKIFSEPGRGTLVKVPLPIEGDTRA